MNPTPATRYTGVAIGLHWLMAALIVAGFALGWTVAEMEFSPQKLRWMSWHKWLGITVLGLVAPRLVWRLTHPAPPLPATIPPWQRGAAHAVHVLLYGLMAVQLRHRGADGVSGSVDAIRQRPLQRH